MSIEQNEVDGVMNPIFKTHGEETVKIASVINLITTIAMTHPAIHTDVSDPAIMFTVRIILQEAERRGISMQQVMACLQSLDNAAKTFQYLISADGDTNHYTAFITPINRPASPDQQSGTPG